MEKLNLLIVEDNVGDARLVIELLKDISATAFEVEHVVTLSEALTRLATTEYDLVIADLTLPDSIGLDVVERCLDVSPDIPIVVLTGSEDDEFARRAVQFGAQEYVYKDDLLSGRFDRTIHYAIERKNQEVKFKQTARTDELTGLPNRRCFLESLERTHSQAIRYSADLAVFFIDLDGFKAINDTLGHRAGDNVLIQIAQRIGSCLRKGDFVGRLGGDEFAVIVHADRHTPSSVANAADRILNKVIQPILIEDCDMGRPQKVSCSIGISVRCDAPNADLSPEDLLNQADAAMYKAKQIGGNSYCYYSPEFDKEAKHRMKIVSGLSQALEREEFSLVYQPIVEGSGTNLRGLEVLLRWNPENSEQVQPKDFVPILEETHQIVSVGEWVLNSACKDYRELVDSGQIPAETWICVNFSPLQFREQGLIKMVETAMETHMIPASVLHIEITESTMMDNTEEMIDRMYRLKSLGVLMAIDDFGTGFSSMSYLKKMPVDYLKIDSSFILSYAESDLDRVVTKAMIGLAKEFGLGVISEGIEDQKTAKLLKEAQCPLQQGFYHAKPMCSNDLSQWLHEQGCKKTENLSAGLQRRSDKSSGLSKEYLTTI